MAQEKRRSAPIAAGGKRGTILHYVENNQTVADGELILIDAGAQWQWYNGDISRTFPVNGKFTERRSWSTISFWRDSGESLMPFVPVCSSVV